MSITNTTIQASLGAVDAVEKGYVAGVGDLGEAREGGVAASARAWEKAAGSIDHG